MGLRARARGAVFVLAMGIVIMLVGLVLVFSRQMRVEAMASGNLLTTYQAMAVADGAAQLVLTKLTANTDRTLLDTEIRSENVTLGEGTFWIVRPNPEDEKQYGYGIQDESGKLNINTATYDMLILLPGMTPELAGAIVDWRDADETITENGAENEYYLLLPDSYFCKNAPFETIDEILMVRSATRELLYGVDANRNGVVDETENETATAGAGLSSINGQSRCGVAKYLTIYSTEPNTSRTGQQRILVRDTNENGLAPLRQLLERTFTADRANAVISKLRDGPRPANTLDFYKRSGLTLEEFKKVADLVTTERARNLVGKINVNTASKEVLRCIPGLDDGDIDSIIATRQGKGADLESIAWVADILSPDKAALAGGFLTTRSFQYSADIVAATNSGRGFARIQCVYDLRNSPPRLMVRRDRSSFGWPLSAATRETLKANGAGGTAQTGKYSMGRR